MIGQRVKQVLTEKAKMLSLLRFMEGDGMGDLEFDSCVLILNFFESLPK
jgi:hypothetical protein